MTTSKKEPKQDPIEIPEHVKLGRRSPNSEQWTVPPTEKVIVDQTP